MNKMVKKSEMVSLATGLTRPSRDEAEAAVRTLIRMAAMMRADRIGGGYRFDADPAFPLCPVAVVRWARTKARRWRCFSGPCMTVAWRRPRPSLT